MADLAFNFEMDIAASQRDAIRTRLAQALEAGEILSCPCSTLDVWVYETQPPEFQASFSCRCGLMRPFFASSPETDD